MIEKERKIAVDLLDINGGLKIIDTSYVLETQNSIEELWLNPSYLLMMAKNVELGLNEYISSSYLKKEIKENYEKLKVSLSELDADYRLSIENAKKKTLIVNNNNLKYLEKLLTERSKNTKDKLLYLTLLKNPIIENRFNYNYENLTPPMLVELCNFIDQMLEIKINDIKLRNNLNQQK